MRESSAAYTAYQDYRAQDVPRSLERLAQTYQAQTATRPPTRLLSTLKDWSRYHAWQERIAAHDRQVAQEREAEEAEKRRKLREARIGVAIEMQRIGLTALREKQPADITAPAAVSIIHEAHETQRRDLGEPDQRVEVAGAGGGKVQVEHSYDADGAPDVLAILAAAGVLAFPARGGAAGGDDDSPAAAVHPAPADA